LGKRRTREDADFSYLLTIIRLFCKRAKKVDAEVKAWRAPGNPPKEKDKT